jgi:RNA-directed DNA polymerase
VLEPLGLRLSDAKTSITHMGDGFDFLGFHIQWRCKGGTDKWHVYTFIADRPVRQLKAKIRALTGRLSQQDLGSVLTRLNQILRGWANYFKHAVAKHTFGSLAHFVWWRVIRMLRIRHRWSWKDVRRRFTTPTGKWLRPAAAGTELFNIEAVTVSRYRYRATRSPPPGPWLTKPDDRFRGEPVALRGARRVRREVRGNGPGAIPTPRPGPTQRSTMGLSSTWRSATRVVFSYRKRILLAA